MLNWMDETYFENQLAEERTRLVRLCAWLTGCPEAAEDLAQEVLLVAWKNREQLWSVEKLKPWLSGIARNICLDWSGRRLREQAHRQNQNDLEDEAQFEGLMDGTDLESNLDQSGLSNLLRDALSQLPADTADLLIDHYLKDTPQADIAAKRKMKPGTVAVNIQRGKLSLQRILQTRLKAETIAYGLVDAEKLEWEETNIWCPNCGQSRLLGQFQHNQPGGRFALRCPACDPDPDAVLVALDLSKPYHAQLLRGQKAYKPAYKRIKSFVSTFYRQALESHAAACPECGKPVIVQVNPETLAPRRRMRNGEILMFCSTCSWAANSSSAGLAMSLPEAERFWRENPRMRTLPDREVESQGIPAVVTQMESITNAAILTVLSRRDTLEPLQVFRNNGSVRI